MATIDNNFIRQYLVNYWDNNGSLDHLSINAKRIYSLIMGRRRKKDPDKPVNDFIYSELGVTPSGRLGEELTFLVRNHLTTYGSLKNYKQSNFYSRLNRLANKLETTCEELLQEAGVGEYLQRDVVAKNFTNLNVYYSICSEILKQVIEGYDKSLYMTIAYHYQQYGNFSRFKDEQPELYSVIEQSIAYQFGGYYDESVTNAGAMIVNGLMYFKDSSSAVPIIVNSNLLIQEALYAILGYKPTTVLSPSIRFALASHLMRHKTLLNLCDTNPRLYSDLKRIYLSSPQYLSLADMLNKEGYYYPTLNTEDIQFIPCQDKEHIIYVSSVNPKYIILDREVLAFVFENKLEGELVIKTHNDSYYVAVATNTKKAEYPPFHMLYTKDVDTWYQDGNYLNISSQNMKTQ